MPTRIAVDAMGGDHAPGVVVEGVVEALRAKPGELFILLAGPEDQLNPLLEGVEADIRQ